jgi:hypothetical protein
VKRQLKAAKGRYTVTTYEDTDWDRHDTVRLVTWDREAAADEMWKWADLGYAVRTYDAQEGEYLYERGES